MILDIVFVIGLIIMVLVGFQKGLVSFVLSLAAYAAVFFVVMYINGIFVLFDTPLGRGIQGVILFFVLGALAQQLVRAINFEDWLVLGLLSRLAGVCLYALIYCAIFVFVLLVVQAVNPDFIAQYAADSYFFQNVLEPGLAAVTDSLT